MTRMTLLDALRGLRPVYLVDIAIVTVLVYALIRVFHGAAARFVVRGLLVLAPVFLVARVLGLHLVASLFEVERIRESFVRWLERTSDRGR